MPTDETPNADASKPILFVLPRGVSAEEAAKLLKEFAEKHREDGKADERAGELTN
jgi:hypothetical protein